MIEVGLFNDDSMIIVSLCISHNKKNPSCQSYLFSKSTYIDQNVEERVGKGKAVVGKTGAVSCCLRPVEYHLELRISLKRHAADCLVNFVVN